MYAKYDAAVRLFFLKSLLTLAPHGMLYICGTSFSKDTPKDILLHYWRMKQSFDIFGQVMNEFQDCYSIMDTYTTRDSYDGKTLRTPDAKLKIATNQRLLENIESTERAAGPMLIRFQTECGGKIHTA
ncbi:MAG: hypothetical protein FWG18_01640 [Alphaproteobacteria bacterium]|nr:hypothetical protein [Alphaproteobacteria bacterium]